MPTAAELRSKHPEFEWTATSGDTANDWIYVGKNDDEKVTIRRYTDGRWYADHERGETIVITGRPEEYKEWSEYQIDLMKMRQEDAEEEDRDGQREHDGT